MIGMDLNTRRAIVCSLSAMMLFGLIDNFVRLIAETGSLWQFHMIRSVVALSVLVLIARWFGIGLRAKYPVRVAGRTFFAAIAMVLYFGCLGVMPVAQAVAGLFTAPIFVVIFSAIFFGERVGIRRVVAVLIGFGGIVLVLRPDVQGVGLLTVMPVVAGAFYAMGNITTRRWCGEEGTMTLLGAFFVAMMLMGAMGILVVNGLFPDPPTGPDGFVLRGWVPFEGVFMYVTLLQGIGSLLGIGLIIRSYQLAEASFIGVFEYAMILFATLWAAILWQEYPDAIGMVGIVFIVAAGVFISIRTGETPTLPA